MKTPSKIFVLVLLLLVFLAATAWLGVRQLGGTLGEFDRVAQVDLVLMESSTEIQKIQLEKEIIFEKLTAAAEELAFGQVSPARSQYLMDYVKGLQEQFDRHIQQTGKQMGIVDGLAGVPLELKGAFERMATQTENYDNTVQGIFTAVDKGGFQLSLEDLERTDAQQKTLSENTKTINQEVWDLVHTSVLRGQRWHQQSWYVFGFSLLLTFTLGLLLFAFKKNLEEISQQKKDLEKVNQELDRFVHTVSHDIAGPLTTIVGYGAYLEKHYAPQLDKQGQDCISGLRKGSTRLNVLIKDMLELTKLTRIKNPYTKIDTGQIIEAAMANCDFMVRQTQAQIQVEGKMPEITCDRVKTTAIFFNLISNGVKFAKAQQRPEVKISWHETPKHYEFYVKDNGIGIDPPHHQDIFDMFKRLHTTEEYGGSGVGLTIVKAAVEDQGGRVRVESSLGQGATFVFTIPKNLPASRPLF